MTQSSNKIIITKTTFDTTKLVTVSTGTAQVLQCNITFRVFVHKICRHNTRYNFF